MRLKPFLLTFLFLLVLPSAFAIGATSCGARYVNYEPYEVVTFSHSVINAYDFTVSIEGAWADAVVYERNANVVSGSLTMPPDWDLPGKIDTFIVFQEIAPPGREGTAVALTRVRCPVYTRVPYPGEYLEFGLNVNDINEGDIARSTYTVASRGNDTVDDARVTIEVMKNGTTHATYSERLRRIEPKQEIRETVELTTSTLSAGVYEVVGILSYAAEDVTVTREMRVGELDVAIINHTIRAPLSDFTRLNFTIENRWNNPVDEVSITYMIANEQQSFSRVTTETFSLGPFEQRDIRSIAETPSILEGMSFIEYTIRFDGSERSGTLPLYFDRPGPDYRLVIFVLLALLITLMIAIVVILFRQNSRKDEKPKKRSK